MASPRDIKLSPGAIETFQQTVWRYYHDYGRHDLPWRQSLSGSSFDPYAIAVSELMLQQTQVGRVIPKFEAFIAQFPTVTALADASLAEVLTAWSGLGYNRRAKFLWQLAGMVRDRHAGVFPRTLPELVALPGIGPNTAGAIMAYAFNQPVVYIETNIRTVYIHHFFADEPKVPDALIAACVGQTLPLSTSDDDAQSGLTYREWYWALMDYGTHLKQTVGNAARTSAQYVRQSKFEGSRRQIRGQVVRLLTTRSYTLEDLSQIIADERLQSVLADLVQEGFVSVHGNQYSLRA